MKENTHPNYTEITVSCSCGNSFETRSTVGKSLQIEVCADCHPFYTGKQKLMDTAGRVEGFNKRFGKRTITKKENKES
jgi:large subunit ribosomal protein L31